jgi:hypothetical protein
MTDDITVFQSGFCGVNVPVVGIGPSVGSIKATGCGTGKIKIHHQTFDFKKMFFVPGLGRTLLSVSSMVEAGYAFECAMRGRKNTMTIRAKNGTCTFVETFDGLYQVPSGGGSNIFLGDPAAMELRGEARSTGRAVPRKTFGLTAAMELQSEAGGTDGRAEAAMELRMGMKGRAGAAMELQDGMAGRSGVAKELREGRAGAAMELQTGTAGRAGAAKELRVSTEGRAGATTELQDGTNGRARAAQELRAWAPSWDATGEHGGGVGLTPRTQRVARAVSNTHRGAMSVQETIHNRLHVSDGSAHLRRALENAFPGHKFGPQTRPLCKDGCVMAKAHVHKSREQAVRKATRPLARVHFDVSPAVPVKGVNGETGTVLYTDEYTGLWAEYFIKLRSEVPATLARFKIEAEAFFRLRLGVVVELAGLRSDGAGENTSRVMHEWCAENGIRHELSAPNSQWQNGLVERAMRTLWEGAEAMRKKAGAPAAYWPYALSNFLHVRNRLPRLGAVASPYEMWHHIEVPLRQRLAHLRAFGCECFLHVPKDLRKKLDDKAIRCVLLGHSNKMKGYVAIEVATGRIRHGVSFQFDETVFPFKQPKFHIGLPSHGVGAVDCTLQFQEFDGVSAVCVVEGAPSPRVGDMPLPVSVSPALGPASLPPPLSPLGAPVPARSVQSGKIPTSVKFCAGTQVMTMEGPAMVKDYVGRDPKVKGTSVNDVLLQYARVDRPEGVDCVVKVADGKNVWLVSEYPDAIYDEHGQEVSVPAAVSVGAPPPLQGLAAQLHVPDMVCGGMYRDGSVLVPRFGEHVQAVARVRHRSQLAGRMGPKDVKRLKARMELIALAAEAPRVPDGVLGSDHVPQTYAEAITSVNGEAWLDAMEAELGAMDEFFVWRLEDPPPHARVLGCRWVFSVKRDKQRQFRKLKARLVCQGFSQKAGVDFDKTFAPTCRLRVLRAMLVEASADEDIFTAQWDCTSAFLHAEVDRPLFMRQAPGFGDGRRVCRLLRTLYGLRQSPRLWHLKVKEALLRLGFVRSDADECFYVKRVGREWIKLLVHVDDFAVTSNSKELYKHVFGALQSEFRINDEGALDLFLGLSVTRDEAGVYSLDQGAYIAEVLERLGLDSVSPVASPSLGGSAGKLRPRVGGLTPPEAEFMRLCPYREAVGALLWLTRGTRPDLAYAVQQVARFMSAPAPEHWRAIVRIFKYLRGTVTRPLNLGAGGAVSTVVLAPLLHGYSDADWAGCQETMRSQTGWVVRLGDASVSWESRLQPGIAQSSAQAEFTAAASLANEIVWWRRLMVEFGGAPGEPTVLWCDNASAVQLAEHAGNFNRTKHWALRDAVLREYQETGVVLVRWVPTKGQLADVFTKNSYPGVFKPLAEWLLGG